MKYIKAFLFYLIQWTWGLPQNLLGLFIVLKKYRKSKKELFFNSLICYHNGQWGGVSLGMFIIMNGSRTKEWIDDTKVHEFGHSIQSLILGPFYLFVIGIPSSVWCNYQKCRLYREVNNVSYFEFYPEKWANYLGSKITKLPVPTL